jgi:peptidoglycan/xylan/chitin deacetylase (PgdA/CDA1 family)
VESERSLCGGAERRRVSVIVYHAIGNVPRSAPEWNGFVRAERFASQMAYLAEHRRVVDLDALFEPDRGGRPRVAITFDDGYRSALAYAVPVLRQLGFPATFFVPTMWVGRQRRWESRGASALDLMTAEELVELSREGFAIESHGHAHIDYSRAEPAAVEADVRTSVKWLTELLGRPPRYFAYPYGRATAPAAAEAARLGLRAGFVLDRPQALSGDFVLKRISIVPWDVRPLFAVKTGGHYVAMRQSAPVRALYRTLRPLVRHRWLCP